MAKNDRRQQQQNPAAKKGAAPTRRRTLILTGSGKLVRGWILPNGDVVR